MKDFAAAFLVIASAAFGVQVIRLARWPFRVAFVLACILVYCMLGGCAALPMPLQPVNEQYNSNMAEGAWLVLDAVDTAQTMHIRASSPTCSYEADPLAQHIYGTREPSSSHVLLTNIALATAHTMVTSWLDDKVAAEDAEYEKDDKYGIGPWMGARFVWHAISLLASASSVVNNYEHGCKL
jgi:hypothetical protein